MPVLPENRNHSSLAVQDPKAARSRTVKSTRKWPAGAISNWTLPVLNRLAKHYPAAVDRVGEIVAEKEHKDNFAACKLIIETLVRDEHVKKGMIDGANLTIRVELAENTKASVLPAPIEGELVNGSAA